MPPESAGNPMTPEGIVVAAVKQYFSRPEFRRFTIETEYAVQMGSDNRRADVVLIDSKGNLAAIAECKREGVKGHGIDQLKAYLAATATAWGMFANSENGNNWKFYQNLGKNQFREITRSEFEKRVVKTEMNLLTRVSDLFTRFFKQLPEDSSDVETHDTNPNKNSRPDTNPDKGSITIKPSIGGTTPVNNRHENGVNPTSNGIPDYSADAGFAGAAAGRGITEALREHIDIIARSDDLEIIPSHKQLQTEINQLIEKRDDLEEEKHHREGEIRELAEELSKKQVHHAGLQIKLEAPAGPDFSVLSEEGLSEDSLDDQHVEEEVRSLRDEQDRLTKEIESNSRELETKKEDRAGLQVELEAPTQTELNPSTIEGASQISSQQRFTIHQWIFVGFATFALLGLLCYLFIFYSSAGDKAFTAGSGTVQQRLNEIINPFAFQQAWEGPVNWFILTFPFIFVVLALVTHFCWEHKERWFLLLILPVTFVLDFIIAIKISRNIYDDKRARGLLERVVSGSVEEWSLWNMDVFAVLLLGFAVSLLLGFGLYWVLREWNSRTPLTDKPEQLKNQIRSERNPLLVQLATLDIQIQHLEDRRESLSKQRADCQDNLHDLIQQQLDVRTQTHTHPIDVEIARLAAEMEILQGEINQLNEQIKGIQEKIDAYQNDIDDRSEHQRQIAINLKKLEARVSEFVKGWSRYVVHNKTELTDAVPTQIADIQAAADKTLEAYKVSQMAV